MSTFVLFLILHIPGQPQPAIHSEDIATLDECVAAVSVMLQKADEKKQLLQAGCIIIPPKTEGS